MTRALIAIGLFLVLLLLLLHRTPAAPTNGATLRLGYNPTYDLWYFTPSGKPNNVPKNVLLAYNKHLPGGVCYRKPDNWFYCKTLETITV